MVLAAALVSGPAVVPFLIVMGVVLVLLLIMGLAR